MALKKFLILSASTEGRNDRVSRILRDSILRNYPDSKITQIDATRYMSFLVKKKYIDTYNNIIKKHPALWGYIYGNSDHGRKGNKYPDLGYTLQDFFSQKLRNKIKELYPDYIIFTHFLPAEQLSRCKEEKLAKVYANVITDFDVHFLWTQKNIDMFFLATRESAYRLESFGINKDKINITGIPVSYRLHNDFNKFEIRERLQLKSDRMTVFVMSGGYGIGDVSYICDQILENCGESIQIIALNEDNEKSRKYMEKVKQLYPGQIVNFEDVKNYFNYMAASDIVITKSDGLVLSECMAMGLPVISPNPLPGEEERNIEYLLEEGVGYKVYDIIGLTYRIKELSINQKLLHYKQKKALEISKKNAADEIIKKIITGN